MERWRDGEHEPGSGFLYHLPGLSGSQAISRMPPFRNHPDDWQRLDYRLLQNGSVVLYRREELLLEDLTWLEEHGYLIDEVDCSRHASLAAVIMDIGATLKLAEYLWGSLDSFSDCLEDVTFPEDGGRVLVLHRFDKYVRHESERASRLLDVLARQARSSLLFGNRWIFIVHSGKVDLQFPALGGMKPVWNPREGPGSDRGAPSAT
jgi:hypothetical protein